MRRAGRGQGVITHGTSACGRCIRISMSATNCRCRIAGAGWQAVNAPLKGGQLTTTAAMGNWSIN